MGNSVAEISSSVGLHMLITAFIRKFLFPNDLCLRAVSDSNVARTEKQTLPQLLMCTFKQWASVLSHRTLNYRKQSCLRFDLQWKGSHCKGGRGGTTEREEAYKDISCFHTLNVFRPAYCTIQVQNKCEIHSSGLLECNAEMF